MKKVFFFGTFTSESTGSKGPSEAIADNLIQHFIVKLISRKYSTSARLLDALLNSFCAKIDVAVIDVYSTRVLLQTFVVVNVLKLRGVKIISVLHGGAIPETWSQRGLLYRRIIMVSTKTLTPSLRIQSFVRQKGLNIYYQPNPIDLGAFKRIHESNFERKNLLWVRAFSDIYNPNLAIKTLAILKGDFPDLKLTMIGPDKGLKRQAEDLVIELGLEGSVDFIGPVANEKLVSYYQSHAVYLNTTSYESFGMAVVEAAATALPIVSTRVGELPYLWEHDVNIRFSLEIETKSFAKEVEYLLRNPHKAARIGDAGAERVQAFNWNSIRKKWIKLITSLS